MNKTIMITLDLCPADRTDGTDPDAGDTAGFGLTAPDAPAAMGQIFQVAPGVAIRFTLPDPPKLAPRAESVQG